MPLLRGKAEIGHNVKEMEAAGHPGAHAVAAALRTAGVPRARDAQPGMATGPSAAPGGAGRLLRPPETPPGGAARQIPNSQPWGVGSVNQGRSIGDFSGGGWSANKFWPGRRV